MDKAHEWTDEQLEKLEKRIAREYSQAAKEMEAKQKRELASYAKEREQRLKALDDTKEARDEYNAWLHEQAANQERMQAMVSDLTDSAMRANERAAEMARDSLPTIYAENANMAAFEIDKAIRADTRFALVDESTVRELMKNENSAILHEVAVPKVKRPADYRWNRQKFTSAITQGILQGESIPNIAERTKSIFGSNMAAAIRAARTATTSAENAGRVSSYERAVQLGIPLVQEWMATLDMRTRYSHRQLDGQQVEVGEPFQAELGEIRFPGDPQAHPAETYNCRCTLRARVKGFEDERGERWSRLPDGMTYEEWKHGKPKAVYELQDGNGRWVNEAQRVTPDWYAERKNFVEFNFDSYSEGDSIASREAIIQSLPGEMSENTVYDYEFGYISEAEYAVNTMARYTTNEWDRYRYDGYLEKAIQETSAQYEGVIFRGVRMRTSAVDKLEVGGTITPKGVQSWSRSHAVALDYCDMQSEGKAVMLVDVTEGKHTAVSIESVSQFSGEKEVLSSGQVEYEIVGKYDREFEHFSLRRDEPTLNATVVEVRERKR